MLVSIRLPVARGRVFAGSGIVALGLFGSSAALAQNCASTLPVQAAFSVVNGQTGKQEGIAAVQALPSVAPALSASIAVGGAVTAANAAFLSQSAAITTAPANARPDSEGAGIWIRGAGGEMTLNSGSGLQWNVTLPGQGSKTLNTTCSTEFYQTFGGFQLGADIAKLNAGGWNLTLGTTAGFLQTTGSVVGGGIAGPHGPFNSSTQAPFVGIYGVATKGNFFVDGLVRGDYFQTTLDSPASLLYNQKVDAHGFTLAASTGYNWPVPHSSWFIEPSAGIIWSRESVGALNAAFTDFAVLPTNQLLALGAGTAQVNGIESIIGRAGLRVGTTMETDDIVYSPFAAASVWHDFAGDTTATQITCPGCQGPGGAVITGSSSTSNIGTFGQYSLGVSGQVKNTGWVGFARADYREGPEVHGFGGTGGIRYQFNPTETALPVKAKARRDHPVDWSGWYGGVIGGATELGSASLAFPATPPALSPPQGQPGWTARTQPSGWLGGGTLGYNFQSGNWVYGLEGDVAATMTNGSAPCAPLLLPTPVLSVNSLSTLFNTTCHDSLDWIATATARLGYAWTPRSLLYVKAGGAFADEKVSATCNYGSPQQNLFARPQSCLDLPHGTTFRNLLQQASATALRMGWTVGIGSEFALTSHWSIKGEFDWLDFGTKAMTLSDSGAINMPASSTLRIAEAKIGLNYKFWPAGPDVPEDLVPLPVKVPPLLPVKAARASTWDGFYLGASIGWEQTSSNWTTNCFTEMSTCPDPLFLAPDATRSHTFENSGARFGTYFGINWQVAPRWLVGVEADIGYDNHTSTTVGIPGCTIQCIAGYPAGIVNAGGLVVTPAGDSASVTTVWDGSLRARGGYLVTPALLVYGTGGLAERMINASASCNGAASPRCFVNTANFPTTFAFPGVTALNESQTISGHMQAGWTIGTGIEWKMRDNIILRGEYRYSDYGTWSPTFFGGPIFSGANPYQTNVSISSHTHTALFGVSYLLGGKPVE